MDVKRKETNKERSMIDPNLFVLDTEDVLVLCVKRMKLIVEKGGGARIESSSYKTKHHQIKTIN